MLFWGSGQAFAQGTVVSKPCPGVLINGVCWAERNVGEPGRFATPANPVGMYYQWNRRKGWSATGSFSGWDSSPDPSDTWETANDPCPVGWRIPTVEEVNSLTNIDRVFYSQRFNDWLFLDKTTRNTIYLPGKTGFIYENGRYYASGRPFYWLNSSRYASDFDSSHGALQLNVYSNNAARGFNVRCVADETACDIVLSTSEVICEKDLPYRWRDTIFREGTQTGEFCFRRTCKSSGCDSIVYLYLTVDTQCNMPCPGLWINGICWARSNVDKPGTFAATPESYGMLYKWNSKKGWPRTIKVVDWDATSVPGIRWEPENDPCPAGWRVPTTEEMQTSLNSEKVVGISTQRNGIKGTEFTYMSTKTSLFFPIVGYISPEGYYMRAQSEGDYWASDTYLYLTQDCMLFIPNLSARLGYSVRCVADKDVPTCSDIPIDIDTTICVKDLPCKWRDTTFWEGTESGTYRFQRISTVTGCDSIVNLNLTVNKCEKSCPGVLINDVCWAEYNVDEPGTFANPGKPYGMLYQWNRKKGWPVTGDVSGWDSSLEPGNTWEPANDPCPAGWRMPTVEEIKTLLDRTKVSYVENVGQDRVRGTRYTDIATGNMIFFPQANIRHEDGVAIDLYQEHYWSSTDYWTLYWNYSSPRQRAYAEGYSVRCVADEDACDIVLTASENICKEALPYTWRDTTFREGTTTGEYRIRRTDPASGCDSIFCLYLTVDTLCGKPCKERGVFINGVCWAESNVDNPNTFADAPESFGQLYQWNRKKGLPPKGTIAWEDWSYNIKDARWEAANNPCPADWRIPAIGDIYSLLEDLKVTREWTQQSGVNGMRFTDKTSGNTIFMPAVEARIEIVDPPPSSIDKGGHYWSVTRRSDKNASYVFDFFATGSIYTLPSDPNNAYSVRCVAGRDTTGCNSTTDTSVTICANALPYEWGDTIFNVGTVSGIYRFQRISTVTGCDSIVNLSLTVLRPSETVIYDTVCQGDAYQKYGFFLSNVQEDATYASSQLSQAGCDSTVFLHLKVWQTYDTTVYDTICQGDGYYRHGLNLPSVTESSTETRTLQTVHGCDSVVTLHLTVQPKHLLPENRDICAGEFTEFRGRRYDRSGTYDDSLHTVHGCDSIYRLILTVHPVHDLHFDDEVCHGNPYNGYGFSLPAVHADTVVSDTLGTATWGCDSIRTLHLTVRPVHETPLLDTVCQGNDYRKHGFSLSDVQTGGEHSLTLPSRYGCDSVLHLKLTMLPSYSLTLHDSVCPSERYDGNGFQLSDVTASGRYVRHLKTLAGCDSIVTLDLHVHRDYLFPETKNACDGDTVEFRGKRLYESGTYDDPLTTVHGCDSIYRLTLDVHPVYAVPLSDILCEGVPYTRYGFNVTEPGVHVLNLKTVHG
ncbi:MAG: hypothetical protein K2I90_03130, partial [Odoribacter sp.]|nr:hypothetical protein [Odoribacter sp.]